MPMRTFSPPSFSSTASSSTMFRNTYSLSVISSQASMFRDAYIVATENANDLAAAVQLDKQSLVEVLHRS